MLRNRSVVNTHTQTHAYTHTHTQIYIYAYERQPSTNRRAITSKRTAHARAVGVVKGRALSARARARHATLNPDFTGLDDRGRTREDGLTRQHSYAIQAPWTITSCRRTTSTPASASRATGTQYFRRPLAIVCIEAWAPTLSAGSSHPETRPSANSPTNSSTRHPRTLRPGYCSQTPNDPARN